MPIYYDYVNAHLLCTYTYISQHHIHIHSEWAFTLAQYTTFSLRTINSLYAHISQFAVAVCCSVLQCVAVCCSVLQCVAVCCSVLQCVSHTFVVHMLLPLHTPVLQCVSVYCSVLQCVAVCCSASQFVAVCHSASRCVAVCCSV